MNKEIAPMHENLKANYLARALSVVVEKSMGVFRGFLEYFVPIQKNK